MCRIIIELLQLISHGIKKKNMPPIIIFSLGPLQTKKRSCALSCTRDFLSELGQAPGVALQGKILDLPYYHHMRWDCHCPAR